MQQWRFPPPDTHRNKLIFTFLAQFGDRAEGKRMFDWKLRIGAKLAIASGFGVLFMAGIVVNQQWSGGSTQSAIEAALRQSQIEADGLNSVASLRGMAIGMRDLRLVRASEEVRTAI